jgi:hypothetical protein
MNTVMANRPGGFLWHSKKSKAAGLMDAAILLSRNTNESA